MGTIQRAILTTTAAGVLALGVACTPEDRREADQELDEAGAQLEQAGDREGEALEDAGAAMNRGLERANERVEPYVRDTELTAKVKAKLTADPEVNPFQIDVDTVDGKVTLTGKVTTERQREEAEHLARGTEGVVEVVNNLEVGRFMSGRPSGPVTTPGRAGP